MSTGPMNEIIVSMTNIVRRSETGSIMFTGSDEAEKRFDHWQELLLAAAALIEKSWYNNTSICERALDVFERSLSAAIKPTKETL